MEADNTLERIDELCQKLDLEIEKSEQHTTQLKARRKKLQNARAVFVEELGAVGGAIPSAVGPQADDASPTLREAALQVVKESKSPDGVSASGVTNILAERGFGKHVTSRVFYSMIYLTLMRLNEIGEVKIRKGPRGRLFVPTTRSRVQLLPQEQQHAH